jgi:hypothetical protein
MAGVVGGSSSSNGNSEERCWHLLSCDSAVRFETATAVIVDAGVAGCLAIAAGGQEALDFGNTALKKRDL